MPSEYRLKRRVQFYETDAAGIVHFSWYLRYLEEAEHALWRKAGLSIASPDAIIGWPRVSVTFEYKHPLHFEDEFEVHLRVVELTNKTIRYSCDLVMGKISVATGSMTIACVQRGPDQSIKANQIPKDISNLFQVWTATSTTQ